MTAAKKTGRPPVVSSAVLAIIQARPGDGLTCGQIAEAAGITHQAVRDAMRSLKGAGIANMVRGRMSMFFASQSHVDAWVAANPQMRRGTIRAKLRAAEWHRLITDALVGAPGSSAGAVAGVVGGGVTNCRRMLGDMERAGEAWRAGPSNKLVWFASEEARDSARASVDAKAAAHQAKIKSHKIKGGRVRAAQKHTFSITAKVTQDKAAVERIKAPKTPPKIVGMETAKRTICPPCDVERYRVDGPVIGGWRTLGPGRYLEPQEVQS